MLWKNRMQVAKKASNEGRTAAGGSAVPAAEKLKNAGVLGSLRPAPIGSLHIQADELYRGAGDQCTGWVDIQMPPASRRQLGFHRTHRGAEPCSSASTAPGSSDGRIAASTRGCSSGTGHRGGALVKQHTFEPA